MCPVLLVLLHQTSRWSIILLLLNDEALDQRAIFIGHQYPIPDMNINLFVATIMYMTSCIYLQAQQKDDSQKEPFTTIRHGQSEYSVAKFTLTKPWIIPQNVTVLDESMEQWKILVLIGESDASRLLTNKQFRELHESQNEISDDLIEAQKDRMRQLYSKPTDPVRVEDLYLVIDKKTAKARLVIPFVSDLGVSYTSYVRSNTKWKIVIENTADPILLSSFDILPAYNELNGKDSKRLSDKELEEITKNHVDLLMKPK